MLNTGTMWSFVSCKSAAKLPAIVQTTMPLTVMLSTLKTIVATSAIQLDILIDNFVYTKYCYILPFGNPLILGNDFCTSYKITLDLV